MLEAHGRRLALASSAMILVMALGPMASAVAREFSSSVGDIANAPAHDEVERRGAVERLAVGEAQLPAAMLAPAEVRPATDYATYPEARPAGCPEGVGALVDPQFDNGRGWSGPDLRQAPVRPGDTITLTWQGYQAGCPAESPSPLVTMALYLPVGPLQPDRAQFDPSVDQLLLRGWSSCGPGITECAQVDGRHRLSLTVPDLVEVCGAQLDAVTGPPLAVVGPGGSYYDAALRGDGGPTTLIGATFTPCPVTAGV